MPFESIFVWSWSVPVAAVVGVFVLGGLWYSPWLFGNVWNREAGINPKDKKMGHGAVVFGVSFLMGLISAQMTLCAVRIFWISMNELSNLRGNFFGGIEAASLYHFRTIFFAFLIGLTFVATSFTINYVFGGRSWKLLAIDAGYHILQFTSYGVIFAFWK